MWAWKLQLRLVERVQSATTSILTVNFFRSSNRNEMPACCLNFIWWARKISIFEEPMFTQLMHICMKDEPCLWRRVAWVKSCWWSHNQQHGYTAARQRSQMTKTKIPQSCFKSELNVSRIDRIESCHIQHLDPHIPSIPHLLSTRTAAIHLASSFPLCNIYVSQKSTYKTRTVENLHIQILKQRCPNRGIRLVLVIVIRNLSIRRDKLRRFVTFEDKFNQISLFDTA